MFGTWLTRAEVVRQPNAVEQLEQTLRAELADSDEETILVIAAMVGLLGAVAYADGEFSALEEQKVRTELSRIHGITREGIDALCSALRRHLLEIATVQTPRNCRILRELADPELRRQVLGVLVGLAAADGLLTHTETNVMRQITTALGLTQSDYNAAQAQYKQQLAVLKLNE